MVKFFIYLLILGSLLLAACQTNKPDPRTEYILWVLSLKDGPPISAKDIPKNL